MDNIKEEFLSGLFGLVGLTRYGKVRGYVSEFYTARCAGGIGPVGLAGFWASPSRM
jgi:hypothetical protein